MAIIAKQTKWTHHYIDWELPLAWGNALCHAFLRMENVECEPYEEKLEQWKMIDEF